MWRTSQPPQSTPHGMCGPHPTVPSGPMMTPFVGHQTLQGQCGPHQGCQHELPFMVQPVQQGQGVPWHPNKIHLCRSLHNNHINKLYHSPIATQQFLHHSKFYLFSNLRHVLNNTFPCLKHLVHFLFKNYQLNQYLFQTNKILLFQNLRKQHHYLPHILNFKHQHQKLPAWTSKPWKIDLMLLWRKSLKIWLNL